MNHLNEVLEIEQAIMLMLLSYSSPDEILDMSWVELIYLPECKIEMHLTKWPVHYVKHKPKKPSCYYTIRLQ